MAFVFEYVGIQSISTSVPGWLWVSADEEQCNIFGRLTRGRIAVGDAIELRTPSGVRLRGKVVRFMESITNWEGLPFYDVLSSETMQSAFCIVVALVSGDHEMESPGVASSVEAEDFDQR